MAYHLTSVILILVRIYKPMHGQSRIKPKQTIQYSSYILTHTNPFEQNLLRRKESLIFFNMIEVIMTDTLELRILIMNKNDSKQPYEGQNERRLSLNNRCI